MKKILLMLLVCFLAVGVFAQTAVSVTNTIQARAQMDPGESGSKLGRLREQVDLRITNDFINFHYRARFNMHDWVAGNLDLDTAPDAKFPIKIGGFIKSFVPGTGDSQANLLLFPVSGLTFGVGTDLAWDVGPVSLWDDDYYHVSLPNTGNLMNFGDWTAKKFAGGKGGRPNRYVVDGIAAKYVFKGLELGASLPFQDFTTIKADGAKVGMRWGAKYTMADVFSVGVGFAGTYDPKEAWGLYAGATINAIEVVKPQIFYNYLNRGSTVLSGDVQAQHNIGLRVPVKVGMLSLDPEFAVSINTSAKDTPADDKKWANERYGAPIFAALPVAYQINDVFAVNLWYSFASGVTKAIDVSDGLKKVMDTRNVIRPGVKLNTGAGIFEVQCAVVLDNYQSMEKKTEVGYLLHMSWEKKF